MLKKVGAVIAGYLVMAALVFSLYTLLLYILGTDGSYKPGSWEPSGTWLALSFGAGLLAAFAGGWVCVKAARDRRAATWLMGLVLVLGLVSVAAQAAAEPPAEPRPAEVSPSEAASKSVTPMWASLVQVALGIGGVLLAQRTTDLRKT